MRTAGEERRVVGQYRIEGPIVVVVRDLVSRALRSRAGTHVVEFERAQFELLLRARLPALLEHFDQRELLLELLVRAFDIFLERRPWRHHFDRHGRRVRRITEGNDAVGTDGPIDRRCLRIRGAYAQRKQTRCCCACVESLERYPGHGVHTGGPVVKIGRYSPGAKYIREARRTMLIDFATLAERANDDGEFALHARFWNATIKLRIGQTTHRLDVRDGRLADRGAWFGAIAGDLTIEAEESEWANLLEGMPRPFYQDLYAATIHHGFTVAGDTRHYCAYYPAVRRLIELMRSAI